MPGELARASGSHVAGCHCPVRESWGTGAILPLPLGPFQSLGYGIACWKFLTSVATLARMEGRGGHLISLKTGPGKELRKMVATTCSAVRNVLFALEHDMPSDAPEAFIAR